MTHVAVSVYVVSWDRSPDPIAVRWTRKQAQEVINYLVTKYPESTHQDYQVHELHLPNFRYTIVERLEERGIRVPGTVSAFFSRETDSLTSGAQLLLQAYLVESPAIDPIAHALDLLEDDEELKKLGIPLVRDNEILNEDRIYELIEYFKEGTRGQEESHS